MKLLRDLFKITPRPEYAPDGSLLSEWKAYWFKPKEDITAYELSLILMSLNNVDLTQEIYVRENGPWKEWPIVERHFVKR